MSRARVVVTVALAAVLAARVAAAQPAGGELPPPAEPSVLLPWKIGQHATYRVTTRAIESTLDVRIVAEDACGFWIEIERDDTDHPPRARYCVARTQAPDGSVQQSIRSVVSYREGEVAKITELDDPTSDPDGVLRLLDATWSGRRGVPREDVTTALVPILALKETRTATRTRWSHPSIPITGLVREVDGDRELLLTDYGSKSAHSSVLADQRRLAADAAERHRTAKRRTKLFAIAIGTDSVGTLDDRSWTESIGVSIGYKFTPRLMVVMASWQSGYAPYPDKPVLAERLGHAGAGLRYYPFVGAMPSGRRLGDLFPVYLQADFGYAQLERGMIAGSDSTVGRGVSGGIRVGLATGFSSDSMLVVELHEHTAFLNADEGVRIAVGINAIVELYLP